MDLDGKKILITGGSTGIGRATALQCAAGGALVTVADVNQRDGEDCVRLIRENGGHAWFVSGDVSSESDVRFLVTDAEGKMEGVNVLVTAAGIARDAQILVDELTTENWDQVINVNLKGSFLSAKYVVPAMRRMQGGVIVLVASRAGVKSPSNMVGYTSSKGGVHGLGLTLEDGLSKDRIRVNVLCPGSIDTPLKRRNFEDNIRASGDASQRHAMIDGLGDPNGVAQVLTFLVSDYADYVRGAVFTR